MNYESLRKWFTSIRIFRGRAPHKPLVLLTALANVQRGKQWLSFLVVNEPLKSLISRYWECQDTQLANEPFWRLKNDRGHFWEVRNVPPDRLRNIDPPSEEDLLGFKAEAGFTNEVYGDLHKNPRWILDLAEEIRGKYLADYSREEVFRAVGLGG